MDKIILVTILILSSYCHAELTTKIIDTGNGLATVTLFPNGSVMLYDTGHYRSVSNTLEKIEDLLGTDREIDLIIESHTDADHIGATAEILKKYKVNRIIRTGYKRTSKIWIAHNSAIERSRRDLGTIDTNLTKTNFDHGEKIVFGDAIVTILSGWGQPPKEWNLQGSEHRNANSIVAKITFKSKTILFTGDAVGRVEGSPDNTPAIASEKYLIEKYNKAELTSDVLIAAHHGSDDANSLEFIKKTNPTWVVFPSGRRYGHPKHTTVNRFLSLGYKKECLLRTDLGDNEEKGEWPYHSDKLGGDTIGDDSIGIIIKDSGEMIVRYENTAPVSCKKIKYDNENNITKI
ncbi:MAG: MBL fold metallo-hydrolase [Colwellia sp.]|jgi:Predicted hydrolase (metallo-beta-lactamase superfamily)